MVPMECENPLHPPWFHGQGVLNLAGWPLPPAQPRTCHRLGRCPCAWTLGMETSIEMSSGIHWNWAGKSDIWYVKKIQICLYWHVTLFWLISTRECIIEGWDAMGQWPDRLSPSMVSYYSSQLKGIYNDPQGRQVFFGIFQWHEPAFVSPIKWTNRRVLAVHHWILFTKFWASSNRQLSVVVGPGSCRC